jgi:hypothetical protein
MQNYRIVTNGTKFAVETEKEYWECSYLRTGWAILTEKGYWQTSGFMLDGDIAALFDTVDEAKTKLKEVIDNQWKVVEEVSCWG